MCEVGEVGRATFYRFDPEWISEQVSWSDSLGWPALIKRLAGPLLLCVDCEAPSRRESKQTRVQCCPISVSMSKIAVTFALGAFISLGGCAGVRYPSYYLLNLPQQPASPRDLQKPVFGSAAVREFSAPRFLKEGSIVYRPGPEQLDYYAYALWAEDPRRIATEALVRELQVRGPFQSVDLYDGRQSPDCLITGSLDSWHGFSLSAVPSSRRDRGADRCARRAARAPQ
jgi:hypothetical protein